MRVIPMTSPQSQVDFTVLPLGPDGVPMIGGGGVVQDSTGAYIDPDSMTQTLAYSGGNLSTITATDGTDSWVQTFTYTDDDLTGISLWVKQ